MNLLIFAHRKEAEAFIDHLHFKPINFYFDGLMKNDRDFLLITGEGLTAASEKTVAVLSQFRSEINQIINLGIAGGLNPKLKKGNIYSIRTSYAKFNERPEFKSYSSNHSSPEYDCISLNQRALNYNNKKDLIPFADLVDRELWAIGSSAHLFKLPFLSFKYISDELNDEEFCKLVIQESEIISRQLLQHYLELDKIYFEKSNILSKSSIYNHSSLYFTVTQSRQLDHYLNLLKNKNFDDNLFLEKREIKNILSLEISPKEKSKLVLEQLLLEVNPIHQRISQVLNEEIGKLKKVGLQAQFDKTFESNELMITFKVKNNSDLEFYLKSLSTVDMNRFEAIFKGDLDV